MAGVTEGRTGAASILGAVGRGRRLDLAVGELAIVEVGGPRIELVELVDYMDRHRVRRNRARDDSMRARARALLDESIEGDR